ncbi:hypothetical protein Pst134EA_015633 [Puccinia striiformis f. sp. tritici]|uniref:FAD-binding domain-containing protein n=1 Tax=Puccinia striiformis f. sp. tritici PST-78 TaxID=1165861 RepID=A0A0L0V3A9_9BASI|nr:hypothetical protein Pst134EA_015633 [Puccinia striiformis f. sp. tritici]KAH9463543.1 hypothetical protein Pst134EA_015633 [Puccinia striiformis f. sp. tritici]KNE93783.1 hypothetical protein PSTG_12886 [Puccinia striiformis f. sp. tritici PST-78]
MDGASNPANLRVLISGIGIAGPVAAYWLSKGGVSVTVLERCESLRKEGQTVDIRNEGVKIMRWMGVEEEVRRRTTKELGIKFVDSKNQTWAAFPQSGEGSFTSEFEIVRGELATIFYEASGDKIEYIFGDSIDSIEETGHSVKVTLQKDSSRHMEFDILIVAEGLTSRTRAKAFNEDIRAPIRSLDLWAASFSYKQGDSDEDWARWYNIPNRRGFLVRPDGFGRVRATALCIDDGEAIKLIASARTSTEKQKEYFINLFKGSGWESDKILEGLRDANDLYVQEIAQTKTKTWSKGRVVLVGDTAFCPSAVTGLGTTAAIAGAYVLAAEIVKNPSDHQAAFSAYDETLRAWVEKIQKLPPGVPKLRNPETAWGIKCFLVFIYLLSMVINSRLFALLSKLNLTFYLGISSHATLNLPDPSTFGLHANKPQLVSRSSTISI